MPLVVQAKKPANEAAKCEVNKSPLVVVIVPHADNSSYWGKLVTLMRVAATQFNIRLHVHYVDHSIESRFSFINSIDRALTDVGKTDYLVSGFITTIEHQILDLAIKHNAKLFSFNAPITQEISESIGRPRAPSLSWVGHIAPDDEQVGYDLAEKLISHSMNTNRQIKILAINGPKSSEVAESRTIGLLKRLYLSKNVNLLKLLNTDWSYRNAREAVRKEFSKQASIDAIWAASDELALAMIDEINANEPLLKARPVIASVDWTPKVVPYLKRQELQASFGGHLFEGVWLLALLHDHFHGLDFVPLAGTEISYRLRPISAEHANLITALEHKNFDFRKLSRCYQPSGFKYKFDALSLLSQ